MIKIICLGKIKEQYLTDMIDDFTKRISNYHKINNDGSDSLGIAVTYGKNHNITVSAGSEVTAKGDYGKAISFDFGGNILGNKIESQGSYAHFVLVHDDDSDDESSEPYKELPL